MYRDMMFCVRCGVWQQDRRSHKMTIECKGTKSRTAHYDDILNKLRFGIFPTGPLHHWPGPFGISTVNAVKDVDAAPTRKPQLPPAAMLALCDR